MSWYVARLLSTRKGQSGAHHSQQCQYLIEATSHDEAYERALECGTRRATASQEFLGIVDLLLIHDELTEGAEVLWSESEMTPSEIEAHIDRKDDMEALRQGPSASGWYICNVVLCEIHDEGSHGDLSLVWDNSYLIQSSSTERAYERAAQIGKEQQDEPGSHRCDGERAHWEFKGVRGVIPVSEPPAPGALLWCDKVTVIAADKLRDMIPEKRELAVFEWEAEQVHQRS